MGSHPNANHSQVAMGGGLRRKSEIGSMVVTWLRPWGGVSEKVGFLGHGSGIPHHFYSIFTKKSTKCIEIPSFHHGHGYGHGGGVAEQVQFLDTRPWGGG